MGRLPERDVRAAATNSRFKWRPSNAMIAVIFILIFTIGPYPAFTGHVPFTSGSWVASSAAVGSWVSAVL